MATIDTPIREILRTATIDGVHVRLTCGQLPRKTYEQVNEVFARLGGKWVGRKVAAHVFDEDPRPLLEEIIATGEMPKKNPLAYFATPPEIARHMVNIAFWSTPDSVLEPSAGEGAICDEIRRIAEQGGFHTSIQAVELDPKRAAKLRAKGYTVEQADFLTWNTDTRYSCVLMNPPFAVEGDPLTYIRHIERAWSFVSRPGLQYGILVAIARSGFTFRSDRRCQAFRALVSQFGEWTDLPPASFSSSGTDVSTCIIVMRK